MYLSGIRLRLKQPDLARPFKVPGGKNGMYIFGGVGLAAVIFALTLCFIPPSELPIDSPTFYTLFLLFFAAPFQRVYVANGFNIFFIAFIDGNNIKTGKKGLCFEHLFF